MNGLDPVTVHVDNTADFYDTLNEKVGGLLEDAARKPIYMIEIESFDSFERNFEALWEDGDTTVP